MRHALVLAALLLAAGCSLNHHPTLTRGVSPGATPRLAASLTLDAQDSGTDALLISAHALSDDVVWAAGTGGTVATTADGGDTWTSQIVPGADTLQFRDVHAFSEREAVVLSIGPGASSRVYRTADGGATWAMTFENPVADGFFDCLAFWDDARGFAFSDSVDGRFLYAETSDGGRSWSLRDALPPAADGEGGFASSGLCAAARGDQGWIATGNAPQPRVLRTTDRGATWTAAPVPLDGGDAAGATSLDFRTDAVGLAVGGSLAAPDVVGHTVARTTDGGATWTAGGPLPFTGAAYGVAWIASPTATSAAGAALAVGPGGVAATADGGQTWTLVNDETHWGLAVAPWQSDWAPRVAWLVGPDGRITRVAVPSALPTR